MIICLRNIVKYAGANDVNRYWFNMFCWRKKDGVEMVNFKSFFDKPGVISGIISGIVSGVAVLIIGAIIGNIFSLPAKVDNLDDNIASLKTDISNDIAEVKVMMQKETEKREIAIDKMQEQINDIYKTIIISTNLRPTEIFADAISNNYNGIDIINNSDQNSLYATTLIAYDIETGEEYTAEQLATQKLLLPYVSDMQEVYFYGQLDESGCWDGDCIINVYENGELILITDAEYDSGNLLHCKQVFSYAVRSGQRVWAISNRKYEGSYSSGETFLYVWEKNYIQSFEFNDVVAKDIISVDDFQSKLESNLYAYYNGNTSDGLFNDETGNAYMIYFFDDGTVRTLYVGNFKDGTFNDSTGNAWYIVKDEKTDYMYYKGCFKDGKEDHSKPFDVGHPPLTKEQINEYISGQSFEIELHWAGFDILQNMWT